MSEAKELEGKNYPLECPNCGASDFDDEGIADMDEKSLIYEMRCGNCDALLSLEWGPFLGWTAII